MSGTMQTSALVTGSAGAPLRALQKPESRQQLVLPLSQRDAALTQQR